MARNDKKEERRQWPTGVLTDEVIKKDVQTRLLPGAIGFTVAAVLFAVGLVPSMMATSQVNIQIVALLLGLGYCGFMAYRSWTVVLSQLTFEIRQDTVVGKRIVADTDKKNARESDLSTRIPILELEQYGDYKIDAEQIHNYYIPLQLVHDFQEGEVLYLVFDKKTKKLLRLYRGKYWTLPEA